MTSAKADPSSTEIVGVRSERAPEPVGPYSQAVVHAGWIFASGQIPLDPSTGKLVEGPVEAQTQRAIENLAAVLEEAGSSLDRVVRSTVYLTDLSLFPRVNRVYAKFFRGDPAPGLPLGACVEIDAIAVVDR